MDLQHIKVFLRDLQHNIQVILRYLLDLNQQKYSNCKVNDLKINMLETRIKILEARLELERHPKDRAYQSCAILYELLDDMENLCIDFLALGGNIRDLGSFEDETDEITDLHQIRVETLFSERGDDVTGIKRLRRNLSSDGTRDLVTASGRGRLKDDLESST
nr:hypothetical protein [Tanacetum cinerariifolium]